MRHYNHPTRGEADPGKIPGRRVLPAGRARDNSDRCAAVPSPTIALLTKKDQQWTRYQLNLTTPSAYEHPATRHRIQLLACFGPLLRVVGIWSCVLTANDANGPGCTRP